MISHAKASPLRRTIAVTLLASTMVAGIGLCLEYLRGLL